MQAINDRHQPRPGSARPGPIGLLIRVVLGAVAVYALVELVTKWDIFRDQNLIESDFWFVTVFTVCLLADVFNIALRRRWGIWPIVVFLAGAAALGSASHLAAGEFWTTALAAWVYAGDLLVFGALSVSFPVAIATRTPGCEFNALPRLVARLRGTALLRNALHQDEGRRKMLGEIEPSPAQIQAVRAGPGSNPTGNHRVGVSHPRLDKRGVAWKDPLTCGSPPRPGAGTGGAGGRWRCCA